VRPALAHRLEHSASGLEAVVGHRELDELAEVFDLECHLRARLTGRALEELLREPDKLGRFLLPFRRERVEV
jgi:hypothetical protein